MKTLKAIISILVIAIALILTGCEESHVARNVDTKQTNYIVRPGHRPLEVVVIDGCEYLYGPWGNATVLTHKGNCVNHKDSIK